MRARREKRASRKARYGGVLRFLTRHRRGGVSRRRKHRCPTCAKFACRRLSTGRNTAHCSHSGAGGGRKFFPRSSCSWFLSFASFRSCAVEDPVESDQVKNGSIRKSTLSQSSSVVEQRTHKPLVAGSIPASGTIRQPAWREHLARLYWLEGPVPFVGRMPTLLLNPTMRCEADPRA